MGLDALDKKLLDRVQESFPLSPQPFRLLAQELDATEADVLARLKALKEGGYVRQIRGVFDNRALGYRSTLAALRIPQERLDDAAEVVGRHPGVSHNYSRQHDYNLWFTLAVPPGQELSEAVAELARRAGAEAVLSLPAVRMFKLKLDFGLSASSPVSSQATGLSPRSSRNGRLSERDILAVRGLQRELPLEARPFDSLSRQSALTEQELLETGRDLLERGVMRRYAALLRHQQMGFKANVMVCWQVPVDRIDEVGPVMASFSQVSHCYQRQTFPEWPYNLYTMVHGGSREECQSTALAISQRARVQTYALLFSDKEYKKKLIDYFV